MSLTKKKKIELLAKVERIRDIKHVKTAKPIRNILAIDQADISGFACQMKNSVEFTSGTWNFKRKTRETDGVRLLRMEVFLEKFITLHKIEIVACELPPRMYANAIIASAKKIGIIEKLCGKLEIEFMEVSPTSIKLFATGKGNANKEKVKAAVVEHFEFEPTDDNEADALWMLMFAKKSLS